jgi:hypothetical protein
MHKDRKVQQHHTEDRRNEDFDQLTLWSGRQPPHDECSSRIPNSKRRRLPSSASCSTRKSTANPSATGSAGNQAARIRFRKAEQANRAASGKLAEGIPYDVGKMLTGIAKAKSARIRISRAHAWPWTRCAYGASYDEPI